jgi:hypothetical protein
MYLREQVQVRDYLYQRYLYLVGSRTKCGLDALYTFLQNIVLSLLSVVPVGKLLLLYFTLILVRASNSTSSSCFNALSLLVLVRTDVQK